MTNTASPSRDPRIADDDLMVLVIDKAGRIVYANPAYAVASGYVREELYGINSARMMHADVPAEVTADMSKTLVAGYPWTGLIKNQRKNGEHYWVRLNLTAVRDSRGGYAGGLLVHSPVAAAEIAQVEPQYRAFREKRARGLTFRHGIVVPGGWRGRLRRLVNPGIGGRIVATMSLLNLGVIAAILMLAPDLSRPLPWLLAGAYTATSALFGTLLTRSILKPLYETIKAANRMAGGDLRPHAVAPREDEIGDAMRAITQMTMNMRATVIDVRDGVHTVKRSSDEIASGNQDLSVRTETQASNLEQTAASIEELSSTVSNNADSARQANSLARDTSSAAERGGEVVARVVATMGEITQSSKKMSEIVSVIDGIAFQTNILALNAAVEAARAGEQGRGFAVVAGEVRTLAQRSAQSAKEIKSLIADSVERVENGAKLVSEAGGAMEDIVRQIRQVTQLVGHIAGASGEQSAGIGQVNQAVTQLENMTQQNAAMVEQSAAAAMSVAGQLQRLTEAVAVFKLSEAETRAAIARSDAKQADSDSSARAGRAVAA